MSNFINSLGKLYALVLPRAQAQRRPRVVTSNTTASIDEVLHVTATATISDPATPVAGRGYSVLVRNGTATIDGVTYTEGTWWRVWHSGAWSTRRVGFTAATNDDVLDALDLSNTVIFADGSVPMTGSLDMDGNSLLGVGTLFGMDGENSVDVSGRALYDSLGSLVFYWDSPGVLELFVEAAFSGVATFNNGANVSSGDLMFLGSSGPVGVLSASGDAARFLDGIGNAAINFSDRVLQDASEVTTLDWANCALFDLIGGASVNWAARELVDDSSTSALNWQGRELHASNGTIVATWSSPGINIGSGKGVRFAQDTVASLGSASGQAGMRRFVTNATATTFGTVVVGGGSNAVPVYSDGTNWRIG